MSQLTANRLREVLSFDSSTGAMCWSKPPSPSRVKPGQVAGSVAKSGYLTIRIDRTLYLAHRLAWLYVHGEWPTQKIDHINGDKHDNRIANLRLATDRVNAQNVRKPQANNTSGFLGVTFCRWTNRWLAQIQTGGKHHNLGRFDTPELAHAAYLQAKRRLHEGSTL